MSTANPTNSEAPSSKTACLFLAMMTLAVFWPIVTYDFVNFDDGFYTSAISRGHGSSSLSTLSWAFTTIHYDNWLPLTLISHMVDLQLFGLKPWGHHLTSLLIHMGNVLILFLAMRRMTADGWRSALVAAVFAVHPLQVESVAWVAERKNVLSAFFCLVALWNYAVYAERPSRGRYAVMLLSFAAALLSKASAVTLPCLLLLLDYWPLRRFRMGWRRLLTEKVPLLALAVAASSAALFCAQQKTWAELPLGLRLGNAVLCCAAYLRKFAWPSGLSVFYPHLGGALNLWAVLGPAALLAGGTLTAIRLRKEKPHLLIGWLWFLTALAPMLGLVQVGNQGMADRYVYVPLIGLAVMAAWAVPILPSRGVQAPILVAAAWICALLVAAAMQVNNWRNSIVLFKHALRIDETNALAHINLGGALFLRGETALAITHYRRALEIAPHDAETHNDLGGILAAQGEYAQAVTHFTIATRLATNPILAGMARENLSTTLAWLGRSKKPRKPSGPQSGDPAQR